jgi:hypothetical protein
VKQAGPTLSTAWRRLGGRRTLSGIVKLGGKESFWFVMVACRGFASGRCHCPPDLEGSHRFLNRNVPGYYLLAIAIYGPVASPWSLRLTRSQDESDNYSDWQTLN